jgi:hypothetical protein
LTDAILSRTQPVDFDDTLNPVVLRRVFVEQGVLEREIDGSAYWLRNVATVTPATGVALQVSACV